MYIIVKKMLVAETAFSLTVAKNSFFVTGSKVSEKQKVKSYYPYYFHRTVPFSLPDESFSNFLYNLYIWLINSAMSL